MNESVKNMKIENENSYSSCKATGLNHSTLTHKKISLQQTFAK